MSKLIHRSSILLAFLFVLNQFLYAQPGTLVTYAGSSGKEAFFDVVQLSDGSFLVGGSAEDLGWIDSQVQVFDLSGALLIQQSINDQQTQLSLNTAHLARGTYLVQVGNRHHQWHKRLLLQ